MLSLLLPSIPAEAYQNTHTLTQNDSVSTLLPANLAGQTLYLHGKAPAQGRLDTWVHIGSINRLHCVEFDGECCENSNVLPTGTHYHSTRVILYQSGTGIGMLTDNIKVKLRGCDTGQQD